MDLQEGPTPGTKIWSAEPRLRKKASMDITEAAASCARSRSSSLSREALREELDLRDGTLLRILTLDK
jgi:hypothetical protein